MPSVILVGPQEPKSDLSVAIRAAGVRGRVALITAGWQEREVDDQALVAQLATAGAEAVNLKLHARSGDVFATDPELSAAYKARQERLREMNDFYRIRLDHAFEAARAISVRHVDAEMLAEERQVSVEVLRQLDRHHLQRCLATHAMFEEQWRPEERPSVAKHRRELRDLIEPTNAIVVAGGHVASLLNRMKLFGIVALAGKRRWFAAAAGAMVLTERIFLFHDFPPHGTGIAEVLDAGFGLVRDLVVLPDPRHRIRLDDRDGIARFVQRIAPATCVAMDHGARIFAEKGRVTRAFTHRLGLDGEVEQGWTG